MPPKKKATNRQIGGSDDPQPSTSTGITHSQPSSGAASQSKRKSAAPVQKKQLAGVPRKRPKDLPAVGKIRRARPARPGVVALREIRALQARTDLLIPKAPFQRLVREIIQEYPGIEDKIGTVAKNEISYFKPLALEALQEAAESYLINFLEEAQLLAIHRNRVTIDKKDTDLLRRLIGGFKDIGF